MYMIHKYTCRQNTVHIKLEKRALHRMLGVSLGVEFRKSRVGNGMEWAFSVRVYSVGLIGCFHRLSVLYPLNYICACTRF